MKINDAHAWRIGRIQVEYVPHYSSRWEPLMVSSDDGKTWRQWGRVIRLGRRELRIGRVE